MAGTLARAALAAAAGYVGGAILMRLAEGPVMQGLCRGAQGLAAVALLLFLPGGAILAATRSRVQLSRFLVGAFLYSIGFGVAASVLTKLIWGSLSAAAVGAVWLAAIAACLWAAKRRTSSLRLQNDLSGLGAKCLAGCAAIVAFVLINGYPFCIDDDSYLPDDTYGRLARLDYETTSDCRIGVEGCDAAERSAEFALYRLPAKGARIRVHNQGADKRRVNLRFFLRNRGHAECQATLSKGDERWRPVRLLAVYDRSRHSRNYHKSRSNCDVLAASVVVLPGETMFDLRLSACGATPSGPVDMVSLSNLSARESMKRLEQIALFGDVADTRETYDLSMSLVDHLFTHTVDYDEGSISGGGYTSVEPLLHHHLNSLALALLGPTVSSMNWVYIALLLLAYCTCCMSVRRLAGRAGWASALALACVFMAYSTFVRPGVEGIGPDTFFVVLFSIALFLLAAPQDSSGPSDGRRLLLIAIALATLTQYYTTPLVCLALCAYVAVFRRLGRAVRLGLFTVIAAIVVTWLRVGVALCTASGAAFWAEFRDQNLARYFGLCREIVFDGHWWLLPYMRLNYAHLFLAVLCASGLLPLLLPWARRREAAFYALTAACVALFIGVSGFQRSHYVAPIVAPLAVGVVIGLEAEPRAKRRAWLKAVAVLLAAAALGVCVLAGRDYTGVFSGFSFWCRTGNMERSRYFTREGLNALHAGNLNLAEKRFFNAVLADPQPYSRGRAFAALAEGWVEAGRIDRGYMMAERAVQSDRDNVLGYIVLGRVLAHARDFRRAEGMIRRALDVDGRSLDANVTMADVLLQQGHLPQARRYLRRALSTEPTHPLVTKLQARISQMSGER